MKLTLSVTNLSRAAQLRSFIAASIMIGLCGAALAHGGGLDKEGCHRQKGERHCHRGAGPNEAALKKAQEYDREDRAAHRLQCRGTAHIKESQPSHDSRGRPCLPQEAAPGAARSMK